MARGIRGIPEENTFDRNAACVGLLEDSVHVCLAVARRGIGYITRCTTRQLRQIEESCRGGLDSPEEWV